jgi:hypothetical protein
MSTNTQEDAFIKDNLTICLHGRKTCRIALRRHGLRVFEKSVANISPPSPFLALLLRFSGNYFTILQNKESHYFYYRCM